MGTRVVAIVQARMASTRLPGKVLREILGRPLLWYLIDRIKKSQLINELIIATTTNGSDDTIVDYCNLLGVKCYRGSEDDVLARYAETAALYKAEFIVRICSDSPLIDPILIDEFVNEFLLLYPAYDYLSNTINQTYPLGMNIEIFSIQAIQEANIYAKLPYEREHVTPYIYFNSDRFNICQKHAKLDLSHLRLTVDVPEDFELVKLIFEKLYPVNPNFGLAEILSFYNKFPESFIINSHVLQKQVSNLNKSLSA